MPQITFIQADGAARTLDVAAGLSLMHAATNAGLPGIVGECGGSCSCATCHVQLPAAALAALPPMSETESDMLDFAASPRTEGSRLGCQVIVTAEMDGLEVHLPETQV